MQITFALIKPHLVKNSCAFAHVQNLIQKDFKILKTKHVVITKELAEEFYEEHKGRFFYDRLLTFMCSGPSYALIIASKDGISKWRNLMGPTKVYRAIYTEPDSIRGMFGLSDTRNACHGSDSVESAMREISIIFPEFKYKKAWDIDGALVHYRPDHLAADTSSSIDAVKEFLTVHSEVQKVALFQCTSVFLREKYIIEAYHLSKASECVFAVVRSFKLRWAYNTKEDSLNALNFNSNNRPRRQDWDGEMVETGMFYFADRYLLQNSTFQNGRCKIVEIPQKDAIEIDTEDDLKLAKCLIEYEKVKICM